MRAIAEKRRRIVWVFPGFGVGGAQMRFAAIANHFGSACTHIVVSLNGDLACREKLAQGLDLEFPDSSHRAGSMLAAIRRARQMLLAQRADLVVTSNWGAIEWAIGARLAALQHVHTEDGFGPEERDHQLKRRVLTRRLALRGSIVVIPSHSLFSIARKIWRLPPGSLRCIPNGVDLARFATPAPADLSTGKGPVIGTIAALRPEKNIARLIRAFASLRAEQLARLVIVGDGPERPALEGLAEDLALSTDILFAGHSTQPERWYGAFDVFALSSDTEQMPLSLLEAMAAQLPAVCTDVGDVKNIVSAENAGFVSVADDAAFSLALKRMLSANMKAIGVANRAKAEALFDQAAMFAAHGSVLGL